MSKAVCVYITVSYTNIAQKKIIFLASFLIQTFILTNPREQC